MYRAKKDGTAAGYSLLSDIPANGSLQARYCWDGSIHGSTRGEWSRYKRHRETRSTAARRATRRRAVCHDKFLYVDYPSSPVPLRGTCIYTRRERKGETRHHKGAFTHSKSTATRLLEQIVGDPPRMASSSVRTVPSTSCRRPASGSTTSMLYPRRTSRRVDQQQIGGRHSLAVKICVVIQPSS